jgi:hypothetical protein
LARVVIISILPSENLSNTEVEAELTKRLESESFSVDRIAVIVDDQLAEFAGTRRPIVDKPPTMITCTTSPNAKSAHASGRYAGVSI